MGVGFNAPRNFSLLLLSILSIVASRGLGHPPLADDARNKQWHMPEGTGEAVFIGDAKKQSPVIVLRKDSLTGLVVYAETDARGIEISGGSTEFAVSVTARSANRIVKVTLDSSPSVGSVKLDGQDVAPVRGKWLQICLSDAKEVAITFAGGTYANLRFEVSNLFADPPIEQRGYTGQSLSPTTSATPDSGTILDRARRSVFLIRTFEENKKLRSSGTGFLVSSDGLALTNFHVVQGASSAMATLNDDNSELPIDLIKLQPDLDLALIRVKGANAPPLSIERTDPRQGDDVWALGYPLGLGYTVNRGIVAGVRKVSELPKELREALQDYDPASRWIQTDCTINAGNSGGPLINARGSVIGVNTWTFVLGSNTNFALRSTQSEELLRNSDHAPISFADAREQYKKVKTVWGVLPSLVPHIELPQISSAEQVRLAAFSVANGLIRNCTKCGGKGSITTRVKVGSHQSGPFIYDDMADRTERCDRCNGSGKERATDAAANRLIENLAATLSTVKLNDPKLQNELQTAYSALHDHVAGDSVVLSGITSKARGLLAQPSVAVKTPIVAHAVYVLSVPGSREDDRLYVTVLDDSAQIVVVSNPVLADEIDAREVLIGGVVAGVTKSRDDRRIVVLQNGFVVRKDPNTVSIPTAGRRGGGGGGRRGSLFP